MPRPLAGPHCRQRLPYETRRMLRWPISSVRICWILPHKPDRQALAVGHLLAHLSRDMSHPLGMRRDATRRDERASELAWPEVGCIPPQIAFGPPRATRDAKRRRKG